MVVSASIKCSDQAKHRIHFFMKKEKEFYFATDDRYKLCDGLSKLYTVKL